MAEERDLLADLNAGLQAYVRGALEFPVSEELPPLAVSDHLTFARSDIPPPGALLLSPDDLIRVVVYNSLANNQVFVSGRLLRPNGELVTFNQFFTPATDRSRSTFFLPGYEGALLSLIWGATNADCLKGHTYVQICMFRGTEASGVVTQLLGCGYVTRVTFNNWPGATFTNAADGSGLIRNITGTDPAVGAEIQETVPTLATWVLRSIRIGLACSAQVATRRVRFALRGDTLATWNVDPGVTQVAGNTTIYFWGEGDVTDSGNVNSLVNYKYPPLRLPAGSTFGTVTQNLQTGDNFSAPIYQVEEWLQI